MLKLPLPEPPLPPPALVLEPLPMPPGSADRFGGLFAGDIRGNRSGEARSRWFLSGDARMRRRPSGEPRTRPASGEEWFGEDTAARA